MSGINIRMSHTDDYISLRKLYFDNDLEVDLTDPVPEEIVRNWKMTHGQGEKEYLAAGITLAMRQGEYIIDGIAVDPMYRKMGLGSIILKKAIEYVKELGGKRIYLVARAPEFFKKNGFVVIDRSQGPEFSECHTCPQFGSKCKPEVMRLDIVG